MRKGIFCAIALTVFSVFSQAQPCSIHLSAIDSGFMSPPFDTFPCIERGVPFNGVLQVNMPSLFRGLIILDSIEIDSFGLPAGLTYATNPSPFILKGDSSGCIAISGTINIPDTQVQLVSLTGHAVITSQGAGTQTLTLQQLTQLGDAPIPSYTISVINPGDTCHPEIYYYTGIQDAGIDNQLHVYPNPVENNILRLEVANNLTEITVEIFDNEGRKIIARNLGPLPPFGSIELPFNVAQGIYWVRVSLPNGVLTRKVVKL
jgi:hypothetical protein